MITFAQSAADERRDAVADSLKYGEDADLYGEGVGDGDHVALAKPGDEDGVHKVEERVEEYHRDGWYGKAYQRAEHGAAAEVHRAAQFQDASCLFYESHRL